MVCPGDSGPKGPGQSTSFTVTVFIQTTSTLKNSQVAPQAVAPGQKGFKILSCVLQGARSPQVG